MCTKREFELAFKKKAAISKREKEGDDYLSPRSCPSTTELGAASKPGQLQHGDVGTRILLPAPLSRTFQIVLTASEPHWEEEMRNCCHWNQVWVEENLSDASLGPLMKREKRLIQKRNEPQGG